MPNADGPATEKSSVGLLPTSPGSGDQPRFSWKNQLKNKDPWYVRRDLERGPGRSGVMGRNFFGAGWVAALGVEPAKGGLDVEMVRRRSGIPYRMKQQTNGRVHDQILNTGFKATAVTKAFVLIFCR